MVQFIKEADLKALDDPTAESLARSSTSAFRRALTDILAVLMGTAFATDATLKAAVVALMQDQAMQDKLLWSKGNLRDPVVVRDLPPGVYTIGSVGFAELVTGLPETYPGTLIVEGNDVQPVKSFRFHPHNATYFWSWQTGTSGTIMPFVKQEAYAKGNINSAVDAFTLSPGVYTIGATSWAEQVANLPEIYPGTLQVIGNAGAITNSVLFYPYNRDYHYATTRSAGGGWRAWRKIESGSGGGGGGTVTEDAAGLANRILREDWSRRRGGVKRISTGAVALRFDHGLANFNSKIRPLLEARGLPYSLALNSARWDIAENTGVTAAMVNTWVQGGLAEIWHHGRNHAGATTEAGWVAEIVTGLDELRAQIPAAQIDGFVIPGTGGVGYGEFGSGSTAKEFYDTPAGRLLLEHHAVCSGYIPNTARRVLDGTVRQGQLHVGMESRPVAEILSNISAAKAERSGLQLMLHPSLVDEAGYMTTSQLTQILDHIVEERNAGRLAVLSPYDLMLADSRPDLAALATLDTGWRDITALVTAATVTSGKLYARRIGPQVEVRFDALRLATEITGATTIATLPAAFVPQFVTLAQAASWVSTDSAAPIRVTTTGAIQVRTVPSTNSVTTAVRFFTSNAWPSTLPGVAV